MGTEAGESSGRLAAGGRREEESWNDSTIAWSLNQLKMKSCEHETINGRKKNSCPKTNSNVDTNP